MNFKNVNDVLNGFAQYVVDSSKNNLTNDDQLQIIIHNDSNEVNLHKEKKGETALAIVSSIKLTKGENPIASEGQLDMQIGWDIDQWERVPTAFRLERT